MFIPYKYIKKFEEEYRFKREIPEGLVVNVEKGQKVRSDSVLASGEVFSEKSRIDLSTALGVKPGLTKKYLECLNGERVQKGDRIAYKGGGVVGKDHKVVAPKSGVINLSGIDAGIVRILGVAKESTIYTGVTGRVVSVIKNKQVNVLTEVLRIKTFRIFGRSIQGELFHINDEKVKLGTNLSESIILLNFEVRKEYLRELAMVGVQGIVAGSIDSSLLSLVTKEGLWGMTLCLIEGFGSIRMGETLLSDLRKSDGKLCLIDDKDKELVLTGISDTKTSKHKGGVFIRNVKVGDSVQVFDNRNWGVYGEVEEISGDFVKVIILKGGKKVVMEINQNNLLSCL